MEKNVKVDKPQTERPNDSVKKPFDKKKWREQKYNKKLKVEQWEEKRRKIALKKFQRELKQEPKTVTPGPTLKAVDSDENLVTATKEKKKPKQHLSAYQLAQLEYEHKQQEKQLKRQEAVKHQAEREAALERYKAKRTHRFKKLCKKTRKGQPLMKDRMQLLLEQIEKDVKS